MTTAAAAAAAAAGAGAAAFWWLSETSVKPATTATELLITNTHAQDKKPSTTREQAEVIHGVRHRLQDPLRR